MKTYKREVATIQLVLHWLLVMFIVFVSYNETNADIKSLVELATGIAVWVYGFAAAAFGIDSYAKQVKDRG